MKFDQKTPVLLPVTGKAAEGFKRLLEKPSNPPKYLPKNKSKKFLSVLTWLQWNIENENNKTKKDKVKYIWFKYKAYKVQLIFYGI